MVQGLLSEAGWGVELAGEAAAQQTALKDRMTVGAGTGITYGGK